VSSFFVHNILFYWTAGLTTAVAPQHKEGVAAVHATRRREEGPRDGLAAAAFWHERAKKGELLFVHMIYFIYWPALLITSVAPRRKDGAAAGHVAQGGHEEGRRGRTGGGSGRRE